MPSVNDLLNQHHSAINARGETVYLRRYAGPSGSRTHTDTATVAAVMSYDAAEIVGSIKVGDQKVVALVDTLATLLPVLRSDKLVIRGRECAIKNVDDNKRRYAGTLIALELQVEG